MKHRRSNRNHHEHKSQHKRHQSYISHILDAFKHPVSKSLPLIRATIETPVNRCLPMKSILRELSHCEHLFSL
nr:MAG TPA: hypothetical protein [Caudoviricetes sp.]